MSKKLTGIKNAIWAVCLFAALVLLLAALIYAAVRRYGGERFSGGIELSGKAASAATAAAASRGAENSEESGLHILPKSKDMGQGYIDKLFFLCDSSLLGLRDYGLLSGGLNTAQIWTGPAGTVPAGSMSTFKIRFPQDGSEITAVEATMIKKPKVLILSLGSDGLSECGRETFIAEYESLIASILTASPQTQLVCLPLFSVSSEHEGQDGSSAELFADANEWLRELCTETGVYYADILDDLSSSGSLKEKYASVNGRSLNMSGLEFILEYLRSHALPLE